MAGYIGSKAVNLSTTGADINGDANIDGDLSFRDNDKAIFGAGSDLQIYHDGSHSYIAEGGSSSGSLRIRGENLVLEDNSGNDYLNMVPGVSGYTKLYQNGSEKLATTATGIDVTGTVTADDAGFYQSSGTSQLRVGASSAYNWNISRDNDSTGGLQIQSKDAAADVTRAFFSINGDISFYEDTGTTPKFFWDASAESLGIGTSSPSGGLHVYNSTAGEQYISSSNSALRFVSTGGANYIQSGTATSSSSAAPLVFTNVGGSGETMRIDSSGNLLVGKTSADVTTAGARIFPTGDAAFVTDGAAPIIANRLTSDGDIAVFRKDGSTVGSIGVGGSSAQPIIGSGNTGSGGTAAGLRFDRANNAIQPWNVVTNAAADNIIDLGYPSLRFQDIYATNGTIQTSDRNEKQDIAELSDAEQRVAVAAKGLLRKFRWRDAVTEKGDEARTHFGIIAQDLQAAFAAEGLDAGDYAMFISSTWTDEETGEERTRMGVRYSELLAFIIGAL